MMPILESLLAAGLLQFGRFNEGNGQAAPFRLSLPMLPSYPNLLKDIAAQAAQTLHGRDVDHYVCTAAARSLGIALSLQTGIPLVYSQGSDAPPALDLVGAYDIGHPAVLLTDVLQPQDAALTHLVANVRRVGLEVHTVWGIIDLREEDTQPDLEVISLVRLRDAVQQLAQDARLPSGQAQAVFDWLSHHHPGSEAP